MPEIRDIPECPIDCLPSEEWQRELLYAFSELRQVNCALCLARYNLTLPCKVTPHQSLNFVV